MAKDIITIEGLASNVLLNALISGPSNVVVVSRMPFAVKSVLPVTDPKPG